MNPLRCAEKLQTNRDISACSFSAEVPFEAVCARCLKTVHGFQPVSLNKTVAVKGYS